MLILFDIDGTLVDAGGAGVAALQDAAVEFLAEQVRLSISPVVLTVQFFVDFLNTSGVNTTRQLKVGFINPISLE